MIPVIQRDGFGRGRKRAGCAGMRAFITADDSGETNAGGVMPAQDTNRRCPYRARVAAPIPFALVEETMA